MTLYLRQDWGAQPPEKIGPVLREERLGVLHHVGSAVMFPDTVGEAMAWLRGIQAYEMSKEYVDIAYNYGVDPWGNQYVLRGDVADGATKHFSGDSFSVLAICSAHHPNFEAPKAMLNGIAECFKAAQQRNVLAEEAGIIGHCDVNVTGCPFDLHDSLTYIRAKMDLAPPAPPAGQPKKGIKAMFFFRIPDADTEDRRRRVWVSDGLTRRAVESDLELKSLQFIYASQGLPNVNIGELKLSVAQKIAIVRAA